MTNSTDSRRRWAAGLGAVALIALGACTGGRESKAAEEQRPKKNPIVTGAAGAAPQSPFEPESILKDISVAIPVYPGAQYREDFTLRDEVMLRDQYGPETRVYTLATNDSFPQVYHYYTTYLAQFRAYPPASPYPPPEENWRTLEVQLNQVMQDPFIPGNTLAVAGRQVRLQVAETEAEPKTVIRYIVTPAPPAGATPPAAAK